MQKRLVWVTVLVLLLFTGVACRLSPAIINQVGTLVPTLQAVAPLQLNGNQTDLEAIFQKVNPGVVAIQTLTQQGGGLGSGLVYDTAGHVVTNYHVVEGATDLEVDFPSGYKVRGTVIATDLDSDLAVIKVDAPASELHPLVLGDSDALKVGQMVVAIGNPFGLNSSMTLGIVSAIGRSLESIRTSADGGTFSAGGIIQTDAAINPGNSGGPLLNLNGEVIGINRAIRTTGTTSTGEPTNSGIGFAVSSNIVKRVISELILNGKYDYPYMGISAIQDVSLMMGEILKVDRAGVYLMSVTPGGPADLAGLKAGTLDTSVTGLKSGGDLIIAVDGHPMQVYSDLTGYLMTHKSPGDPMKVTFIRAGEQKEVTVTLAKRP